MSADPPASPLPSPPASTLGRWLAWPVTLTGAEPPAEAAARRTACTIACWEVLAFQTVLILTTGDIITALALHLEFGPVFLGVLATLPAASTMLHPLGAWAVERLGRKKPFHLWLVVLSRIAFFVPALLWPILPEALQKPVVFGGLVVANALFAIATNAWQAWMGDLSDGISRGRFFGFRNALSAIAALVVSPVSLRYLGESPGEHEFTVLFLWGVGAAVLSLGLMGWQAELPTPPRATAVRFRQEFLAPIRDRNYRNFLLFRLTHDFGVFLAAPFWLVYHREIADLSFSTIAGFSIVAQLCAMGGFWFWGQMADRIGHKPVVILGVFGAGLTPLFWYIYTPQNWWLMYPEAALSGFFWSGMLAQSYTLAVGTAPVAGRSMYLALLAFVSGIAALIGGALGGMLVKVIGSAQWAFGDPALGMALVGYHLNFTLSMCFRLGSLVFLRRFHEPDSTPTLQVLGYLVTSRGWRKGFFAPAHTDPSD